MAANDYYNTGYSNHQQPSWNHASHPVPTAQPYSSNPYGPQQSQYTLSPDHDSSQPGGGKYNSNDYADDIPLKPNASQPARPGWHDEETQYPPGHIEQASDPSMHRAKKKRRSRFKRIPWVVYITSTIQVAVFIAEIAKYAQLTGSPIMIHPQFNPMIGPSPYVQINMGARFVACMRNVKGIQDSPQVVPWPCPQTTSSDPNNANNKCTLSELCGLGGVPNPKAGGSLDDKPEPNQWFRFIIPIFLHAGLIHIGVNLLAQMIIGADMERNIGWWRFAIVYYASGIFGFVLGGNFAAPGIASTGASGSLFGVLSLALLDLLYKWNSISRPFTHLMTMLLAVGISFVLGLLPGLDNFSHIGGFLMGLVLGICLLRSPDKLRERIGIATPYMSVSGALANEGSSPASGSKKFMKQPVGFFKGRKPLWWGWWLLRAGAFVGILVAFILLLNNFYKYRTECSWCKYLSCLPIKNWCDVGNLKTTTTTSPSRRELLASSSLL